MRVLLDTCAFLWFLANDPQLSPTARGLIADPRSDLLLSRASLWEISIKQSKGGLLTLPPFPQVAALLSYHQIRVLEITDAHLHRLSVLPFIQLGDEKKPHQDPFDRTIVAQAIVENLPVLTSDEKFDRYGIMRRW